MMWRLPATLLLVVILLFDASHFRAAVTFDDDDDDVDDVQVHLDLPIMLLQLTPATTIYQCVLAQSVM